MKLWVDDIRKEPDGWTRARSVTEAIRILDTMDVEEVSLDHDISHYIGTDAIARPVPCCETFEPVARFISWRYWDGECGKAVYFAPKITLHSANSVGAEKMKAILVGFDVTIKLSKPCNRFDEES